ncbi:hypothetical protein [Pseudoalteromonas luteoviolacea]|uniref:hypothetical protein n=1 Tax=Pseudoalteromonas luteoviolacea TaxID=43657 RepID=UPI00126A0D8C|nr:hypothetical protein [Pseudoalteromonas luteoviolacea]
MQNVTIASEASTFNLRKEYRAKCNDNERSEYVQFAQGETSRFSCCRGDLEFILPTVMVAHFTFRLSCKMLTTRNVVNTFSLCKVQKPFSLKIINSLFHTQKPSQEKQSMDPETSSGRRI